MLSPRDRNQVMPTCESFATIAVMRPARRRLTTGAGRFD